jgi:serine/threonine-protein kinase RsbW
MTDNVELTFPVLADLVVLARLVVSTVAARADFDVEEIEDLKLAVDELCVSMVHERADGRLALLFTRDGDVVEVSCTYHPIPGGSVEERSVPSEASLSERILDALVDEHGNDHRDGLPRAWMRKRRARQRA